jgi:hypothetical protein
MKSYEIDKILITAPETRILKACDCWAFFWPVCLCLGLNVNRFWFLNFNDALLILHDYISYDLFQAISSLRFLES